MSRAALVPGTAIQRSFSGLTVSAEVSSEDILVGASRHLPLGPRRRPRTRTGPVPVPETGGALPPHVSAQVLVRPRGFEPPGPSVSDWGVYPSCATAADPWCPVRESHPHRLDVSEASCCWKNRTGEFGSGTLSRTGCRRLMKPSETRSSVPQYVSWWTRWDSNPQDPRSERGASAGCATSPCLHRAREAKPPESRWSREDLHLQNVRS